MSDPEGWAIALERIAAEAEAKTGILDLGRLGLTDFPEELFALSHLRALNLGYGRFDEGGIWELDFNFDGPANDLSLRLTALSELPDLRDLLLARLPIDDLSPLATFANLQSLNCSFTKIRDLAPIATLQNLQSLDCRSTQVRDLAPIATLQNLQSLDCSLTQVHDLAPIAALQNLQSLDCSFTQVSDLAPIATLQNLQSLDCRSRQVSDLAPLETLQNLQSLNCSFAQVSDLAPIATLQNLQSLNCSFTQVSDLAPIATLQNLQSLDCSLTQVHDLAPIATLQNLQSLTCRSTQVTDLAPIATLQNLQSIDCSGTQVSDLAPIAKLQNLQSLSCSATQVSDLAPIATLQNLQSIDCSGTQVSDLAPIAGLKRLQKLLASACRLDSSLAGLTQRLVLNRQSETEIEHKLVLYATRIPDAPPEVLSESPDDDCLGSLRAHYDDLAAGSAPADDVKLMVLGNGRVGKTQICRRLRGEGYKADESSTHGIVVSSVPCPVRDDVKLHIWDFGGQDIYHGAHALFMRSNAVFLIVWSPGSEDQREHEYGGMIFRNYPLAYLGGKDACVVIVQTRCDRPEDKARCPVSEDVLWKAFDSNFQTLHYSALTDLGRGALNDALAQTVTTLHNNQGVAKIGLGRHRVKRRLEAMRDLDANSLPEQRHYRWLTQEQFRQICEEDNGPKEPKFLLRYLHNVGVVFHREGAFDDRIILDQQWALEAIYAVFNRDKCYRQLRQLGGRFTRTLLDALVWRDCKYSADEQRLFISMMQSCGVCFALRKGDEKLGIETDYVAPDLLPERALLQQEIDKQWDDDAPVEEAVFDYALLHQGLIRSIISRVGREAGISATYWKGGLCVYEKTTRSHALIEQRMIDDSAGNIHVATQGGQSAELLRQMIGLVTQEQEKLGLKPRSAPEVERETSRIESPTPGDELVKTQKMTPAFGAAPSAAPRLYVSYAWDDPSTDGKRREAIVDQLCVKAEERGTPIKRDKHVLRVGDSISKFMQEIGEGDRVFVILSDKYLKSSFCMFELFEIWRNSRQDKNVFIQRCRVYTLDDADIWSMKGRIKYATHWKAEHDAIDAALKENGASVIGEDDFANFKLMQHFVNHIGDVLTAFAKIVQPRTLEDLEKYGFDDPSEERK